MADTARRVTETGNVRLPMSGPSSGGQPCPPSPVTSRRTTAPYTATTDPSRAHSSASKPGGCSASPHLLSPPAVPPGGSEGGSVGPEPPPGIKTPFLFGAPPEKNDFPPVPSKAGNLGLKRPQMTGTKWISVHPNHRAGALGSCSRVVVTSNRPVSHRRSRRGCFPPPWVAATAATQGDRPTTTACTLSGILSARCDGRSMGHHDRRSSKAILTA